MSIARNWVGTLQLEDETLDAGNWFNRLLADGVIKFAVGQIERGHETEHAHLQFYVQLAKKARLNQLKKLIDDKAHWEVARGTAKQCIDYCTKEDTRVAGPWTVGEPSTQGQRTELEKAADMILEKNSMLEVAMECKSSYIRYHRGLQAFKNLVHGSKPRDLKENGPEVWIFWGDSGSGKTKRAFENWPDAYVKLTNGKWWDGYEGQETVIFDDFKGSSLSLHDFQRVIDRYPLRVETKGGTVELQATRYVFTSNRHPSEWYSEEADPHKTVMRRVAEFCQDHGRLLHFLGRWMCQGSAEVTGNTGPSSSAHSE